MTNPVIPPKPSRVKLVERYESLVLQYKDPDFQFRNIVRSWMACDYDLCELHALFCDERTRSELEKTALAVQAEERQNGRELTPHWSRRG